MSETLNDTTLFSQTFTLNDDGTRASSDQSQLQPDGSTITTDTTWSNNALGELTSETLSSTSNPGLDYTDIFKYDLVGNRLTSAHTGPGNGADENITNTYNGDDELTKEVSTLCGETDLAYDPNGSLTSQTNGSDVTTYGYDVRNKMVSADVNGVNTTYVYDDAGNRVGETAGGVTTFYLTDDDNPTGYAQPIEQKASAAAAPSVTYIIGDRVLGQANASGAVSYLLNDGHGSTRALTSSTGAVAQTFNYTAFGNAIGFNPATAGTVFLFGGDAVYDTASGLYLHGDGTRPTEGFVFTQMDDGTGDSENPLSLQGHLYAWADPVNSYDPSGHDDFSIAGELTDVGLGEFMEADAGVTAYPAWVQVTAVVTALSIIAGGGLAWTQNGSPTTILGAYGLQVQTQLQQNVVATGQAYQQAVKTAVASGKYTTQQVQSLPVFWVFQSITPQIYQNDADAMAGKGTRGGASAPDVLTYVPGINKINRPGALGWALGAGITSTPGVTSLEEYPFASTAQGGATAWLRVAPVAIAEQNQQRNDLNGFYTQNTSPRFGAPFAFLVALVP